ncbi:MAG TPA: ABC transporter substrate-binding protein, partial [Anaerolineae bacterium]
MSANSRIRWFGLVSVFVLLLPVLAACGGAPATPAAQPPAAAPAASAAPAKPAATSAPAAAQPAAGGAKKVLRMSRNAEPFSPFIPWQIDDNPALFISVNIYDSLLRMTPDGQGVQAGLASKWEPAADGLSWTFTLRDGLKYSDGSALKAEDVQASLLAVAKSKKSSWASNYKAIKDVQVVDPKTIKVLLSEPFAPL